MAVEDKNAADQILEGAIPEAINFGGATEYLQPRCPKCKSLDLNFEELYKPLAYGSLLVNLPIPVHRQGWICQTCRYSWDEAASGSEMTDLLS